jgi:hypothetical protein
MDMLYANGFVQSITKPIGCSLNSATCIDHFLTNFCQDSYESIIVVSMLSDHFPVLFLKNQLRKHEKIKYSTIRDFSDQNISSFSNRLASVDWRGVMGENDPDAAFSSFSDTFGMIHENFFAPKNVRFNKTIHTKKSLDDFWTFNITQD